MRGSWRPNTTATYWSPLFWLSQSFFPVLLGYSTRGHGSHSSIFSPTDLNFQPPGLYNNLMPTYFLRASQFHTQFNPSTVKVAPDLFDQMHLLFTQVHFFFWQLGRVGGQYATLIICLHTVKWLQVLQFNTNCSIQQYSFVCTQLNGSKYYV